MREMLHAGCLAPKIIFEHGLADFVSGCFIESKGLHLQGDKWKAVTDMSALEDISKRGGLWTAVSRVEQCSYGAMSIH